MMQRSAVALFLALFESNLVFGVFSNSKEEKGAVMQRSAVAQDFAFVAMGLFEIS